MPSRDKKAPSPHSDACIIESLREFFLRDGHKDEHELGFCSENVTDFGLVTEDRHIIHPLHKDSLPLATEYCISLQKLIEFCQSENKATIPSPVQVEQALQQQAHESVKAKIVRKRLTRHTPVRKRLTRKTLARKRLTRKTLAQCDVPKCYEQRLMGSRYCEQHQFTTPEMPPGKAFRGGPLFERLVPFLNTLPYREREIVRLRYGLYDGYSYTPQECGHIFKISTSEVIRIEREVFRKMMQSSAPAVE